ncbi:hypothetical protein V1517DRAFT_42242 [Lipomyces orientalis]|uniref:Uncharacterized protein n=1 Tax=Lipomyces orientalis TaxID=1233043 RepID=A0ACC3TEC7_9ASCO
MYTSVACGTSDLLVLGFMSDYSEHSISMTVSHSQDNYSMTFTYMGDALLRQNGCLVGPLLLLVTLLILVAVYVQSQVVRRQGTTAVAGYRRAGLWISSERSGAAIVIAAAWIGLAAVLCVGDSTVLCTIALLQSTIFSYFGVFNMCST